MIKANGYGHGLSWVIENLYDQPHLYGFGVATLSEALKARIVLNTLQSSLPILVFSGATPLEEWMIEELKKNKLRPVITSISDLKKILKYKIPYDLKFNTGMNRLGIEVKELSKVKKLITPFPPITVLTHLAQAYRPRSSLSQLQKKNWIKIKSEIEICFPEIEFHIGNTGAILKEKIWNLDSLGSIVRPGIGLYGSSGDLHTESSLKPVMSLFAQILSLREISKNDRVGYDGTYCASKKERIAQLGIGYGDGISRLYSDQGEVFHQKKRAKLVGRVSMDLLSVKAQPSWKVGQWVEIFGENITSDEIASLTQTISYEVLTSLTDRVQRVYVD
tara:strand:- start:1434 stop:2432 length:999 start_codon:yes stop_codon:yes gene_type:complete